MPVSSQGSESTYVGAYATLDELGQRRSREILHMWHRLAISLRGCVALALRSVGSTFLWSRLPRSGVLFLSPLIRTSRSAIVPASTAADRSQHELLNSVLHTPARQRPFLLRHVRAAIPHVLAVSYCSLKTASLGCGLG